MHIKQSTSLIAFALVVFLTGCSSDNDNNSSDDTSTTQPAPGENPTDAITMDGLAGQWSRTCSAVADSVEYSSAELNVADNVATVTESFYTDSACTTAASPAMVVTDNSLVFDDTTTSTSLGNANNVESTVESKTVDGTAATDGINVITYDIMLITNNTLYFGSKADANNGSTEALRPQTLDQIATWSNL